MNTTLATKNALAEALLDARSRTLALVEGLNKEQLIGPILPTLNPLRWEIAHTAYFHEFWVLRHLGKQAPILPHADELFDSISIQHEDRWQLQLPSLQETFIYMNNVLKAELLQLRKHELSDQKKYFYLLALFHEDMHCEAFTYTRQTLAYPAPKFITKKFNENTSESINGLDIEIPGGKFLLGADRNINFVFDNEKWAHEITIAPFRIAKYAVRNEEYLEFVEANGYETETYWDAEGWQWRSENNLTHPLYWKKDSDQKWYERKFDQWLELQANHAVIHISWYEAKAYCQWADRRLPTEIEWEFAAACGPDTKENGVFTKRVYPWGNELRDDCANFDGKTLGTANVNEYPHGDSAFGCRQMMGNVWEWTDSTFLPYPGFSPDCYTEYSRPLFATTKVLRGGAWTTRGRMLRNTWRNYYGPDRNDIFAGFRTCVK